MNSRRNARADAFQHNAARRQKPTGPAARTSDRLRTKRRRLSARRRALVESHLPLVRYVAERLARRLPAEVDVDDLVSAGIFGLVAALETFDPARGVKFTTYCVPCIRGAILDELREMDWVPRLARSRARKLREAVQTWEAQFGGEPSDDELLDRLRVPIAAFRRMQRDARIVWTMSIDVAPPNYGPRSGSFEGDGRPATMTTVIADEREPGPENAVDADDLFDWLSRGFDGRQRFILAALRRGLTLRRIGDDLGLSESRVSQLRSRMVEWMRRRAARHMHNY